MNYDVWNLFLFIEEKKEESSEAEAAKDDDEPPAKVAKVDEPAAKEEEEKKEEEASAWSDDLWTMWAMSCKIGPKRSLSLSNRKKAWLASFGMTPTVELYTVLVTGFIFCSRCCTKRRLGRADAIEAFVWYDNDKDLQTWFCAIWFTCVQPTWGTYCPLRGCNTKAIHTASAFWLII